MIFEAGNGVGGREADHLVPESLALGLHSLVLYVVGFIESVSAVIY
jgi:hypothetical protein